MKDGTTDPAAIAASTAQGWAYALNTVARPAPEHLEAAQEALTALGRTDRGIRWAGVADALSEALTTARLRVDGRPAITVDQLLEALDRLQERGLEPFAQRPDAALAQAVRDDGALDRITELEEEVEDVQAERAAMQERLDRAVQLRDRFEQERDQLARDLKSAHAGHSAAIAAGREDSRRAGYLWTLAQLGNNLPAYALMSVEELREAATKRLGEVQLEAGQLRAVTKDLVRIGRRLADDLDGGPWYLDESQPVELARTVAQLADRAAGARRAALARQRELEDRVSVLESDGLPELAAVRAERDMLMAARDAQAEAMRTLRAERDAAIAAPHPAEARAAELEEALAAERSERSEPSPDRWVGVLRERDRQRQRITALESERDRLRRRVTELAAE